MATTFEYLEVGKHHIKTDELNELGKDGWEMITALRMSRGFQMFFKRQKGAELTRQDAVGPTPQKNRGGRPKGSKNKPKP